MSVSPRARSGLLRQFWHHCPAATAELPELFQSVPVQGLGYALRLKIVVHSLSPGKVISRSDMIDRQIETNHLDVPRVLELPLYQWAHFWMFFPSIECRTCREPQFQVCTSRFTKSAFSRFVVQDIIHELFTIVKRGGRNRKDGTDLERNTKISAIRIRDLLPHFAFLAPTKNNSSPSSFSHQARRL